LGSNCGEQLCGIAAALTNNSFEERQLWGVALANNFGRILTALGSSCSEQLSIIILGNGFGEELCGVALGSSLGKQEQLRGAALGNRFEA
jgi:hypothetical protein